MEFLTDQESEVRTQAALSLDHLGNCEPIIKLVQSRSFRKRDFREKQAFLELLARCKTEQSIPILEKLLRKRRWFFPQSTTETRTAAVYTLGTLSTSSALKLLDEFSRDPAKPVRKACFSSLQRAQEQRERKPNAE